jgi:hypothetical protein
MDFRKATDELLAVISHQKLAEALGVSVPTVRQARLDPSAKARRNPPEGWERVVAQIAKREANRLERLSARLEEQAAK